MVNNQGTPTTAQPTSVDVPALFRRLGQNTESLAGTYNGQWVTSSSDTKLESFNPSTGELLARVAVPSDADVESTIAAAKAAQLVLRKMPAPQRGHILRDIRTALAEHVDDLGMLITLEMGKVKSEGRGEVVEFLDVADIALGLSRQIGGVVLPSERGKHFMTEVANPLGVVGVISAFNFPIAVSPTPPFYESHWSLSQVFGWNFSLAFICGNASIWKPAETTPLCAIATTRIIASVLERHNLPGALCSLLVGGGNVGAKLVEDPRVDLISFTGSEARGRDVGIECAKRFKQTILELGGNNVSRQTPFEFSHW
jgi:aldehyde dehydrogenase family 7 protein A1